MIYDKSGNALQSAYTVSGADASAAYDVDGVKVFSRSVKVMSFNAQGFSGINSQSTMLNAIFSLYDADIIGFQEFCSNGSIPSVAASTLSNYPTIKLTNHKNYNGIATKLTAGAWTIADYQTQDPYDISEWNETRCYMKTYFNIGGRQVAFFNTHLCLNSTEARYAQAAELFALAEAEEYCIITGDFNSTTAPLTAETADYINEYKPFVDAGYHLANNSPTAGFTNTHSGATSVASLAALTSALDSIIVSGNIDIDSVVFDPTKLSYQNGQKFDHIPVVATLTIN